MSKGTVMLNSGGMTAELIYTNPSPSTAMEANTFSFDASKYDYFQIEVQYYITTPTMLEQSILSCTGNQTMTVYNNGTQPTCRNFVKNGSVLSCTKGFVYTDAQGQNYNIPTRIWGIKGQIRGG